MLQALVCCALASPELDESRSLERCLFKTVAGRIWLVSRVVGCVSLRDHGCKPDGLVGSVTLGLRRSTRIFYKAQQAHRESNRMYWHLR